MYLFFLYYIIYISIIKFALTQLVTSGDIRCTSGEEVITSGCAEAIYINSQVIAYEIYLRYQDHFWSRCYHFRYNISDKLKNIRVLNAKEPNSKVCVVSTERCMYSHRYKGFIQTLPFAIMSKCYKLINEIQMIWGKKYAKIG